MSIFYPDIASYQAGIDLKGALAVCAKATQGTTYTNPHYTAFQAEAKKYGTFFFAYHFLESGSTGAQARHCHQVTGATPLMIDAEPTGSSRPTLSDITGFTDALRALGGVTYLVYLPRWYWQQAPLNRASLDPLRRRGLLLVSSEYTAYSDTGSGWNAYGGMAPVIWQYTSTASFNGYTVDFNAFKGSGGPAARTLAELRAIVETGKMPGAQPTAPGPDSAGEDDDDMMLKEGKQAVTMISFGHSSRNWIALACDNTLERLPDPKVRIAVHSRSKGWSQVETLTVTSGKKPSIHFKEPDVDCLSLRRENTDGGENAAVGYNMG